MATLVWLVVMLSFADQLLSPNNADAAVGVSSKLSYQGRLTDASGNPYTGTYYVCFSIWDNPTVGAGTQLWPAGVPNNNAVTVTNGVFNASVGVSDALNYDFSSNDTVYLNVGVSASNVACNNGAVENLTPRQRVDATAYARVAADVYGTALRTSSTKVQIGAGTGQATPILLGLDVKNSSDTVGGTGCTSAVGAGSLWYNSNLGITMVCNNNTYESVGLSNQYFDITGPSSPTKTFTFPNYNTTVLTSSSTPFSVGDMFYASSTIGELSKLAIGTAGYVLTSNGPGLAPKWAAAAGGGGGLTVGTTAVTGGTVGAVMYEDATNNFNEAANVNIDAGGNINLAAVATPAASAAGMVTLYGRDIANRIMLAINGPSGQATTLQPLLARNKIGYWNPQGNSTVVPGVFGFTAPTVLGTATARNVATTNFATRLRRLGYVSAATAGSLTGQYHTVAQYTVGTGTGLGGFTYIIRFVPSSAATLATSRMFIGLSSLTSAPTNVEPSSLTNAIGVAKLSTSQNLFIVYGGSAAQTAIDLGAGFPADTLSTEAYELALFAPQNANNVVGYVVTRLSTGATAAGTLTAATPGTQLPSSTTLLAHRAWRTNNATAQAVGIDIASVYIETDD